MGGITATPNEPQNFLGLGVKPGGVLLVHTSFSKIKPIEGGPLGLISAFSERDCQHPHDIDCGFPVESKELRERVECSG